MLFSTVNLLCVHQWGHDTSKLQPISHRLNSTNDSNYTIQRTKFGERASDLPSGMLSPNEVCSAITKHRFNSCLKTHYFKIHFNISKVSFLFQFYNASSVWLITGNFNNKNKNKAWWHLNSGLRLQPNWWPHVNRSWSFDTRSQMLHTLNIISIC